MSDPHDGDSGDDPRRRGDGPRRRGDDPTGRSSIVHLGVDVGGQPLTNLLGGLLDVKASTHRDRGDRQRVDDAASGNSHGQSGARVQDTDEPVEVADEYLVETHRTDDEFVVTAELPGVDEEDLSVGIDVPSNELVIAARGKPIDRVELPWPSTDAAKVWYNNGILEVRLRPVEGEEVG